MIHSEFDIALPKRPVLRRLHESALTFQKPEREYFELPEEERREWIRTDVPRIRRAVRKHRAILYFQHEANVSLTALLAKTWTPRGQTPKQRVTGKRGSVAALSALSAISRSGQLLFRLLQKRIASAEVMDFLSQDVYGVSGHAFRCSNKLFKRTLFCKCLTLKFRSVIGNKSFQFRACCDGYCVASNEVAKELLRPLSVVVKNHEVIETDIG